jgi:hypothetical protein
MAAALGMKPRKGVLRFYPYTEVPAASNPPAGRAVEELETLVVKRR